MALTKVPSNLDATVATTQSASDNSTNVATTAYVTTAISNLVDGAPSTLNTLNEIAAALNDDAALNTTLTNSIAAKLPLAGGTMTGALIVDAGNSGLDVRVGTDKRVLWQGNIGEIGSVAGFQAVNTAGSANTDFGIRATTIRLATGSSEKVRVAAAGHLEFNPVNSFAALNNSILSSSNTYLYMMGGAAGLYLANNSGLDTSIGIRDANYIDFNTSSGEQMRLTSAGILDIGKASFSSYPAGSKLNVYADGEGIRLDGTGNTTRRIRFRNVGAGSGPGEIVADGSLIIKNEDANAYLNLSSVRNIEYQVTSGNGTAGHHIFSSYNTEIMRLDGASNNATIVKIQL